MYRCSRAWVETRFRFFGRSFRGLATLPVQFYLRSFLLMILNYCQILFMYSMSCLDCVCNITMRCATGKKDEEVISPHFSSDSSEPLYVAISQLEDLTAAIDDCRANISIEFLKSSAPTLSTL